LLDGLDEHAFVIADSATIRIASTFPTDLTVPCERGRICFRNSAGTATLFHIAEKPPVVMPIRAAMESAGSFGPQDVDALVFAFEDTLRALGLVDRNDPAVALVAQHIIEAAKHGERDPKRLREAALKLLSK
jgi:hypothetical protein